MTKHRRRDLMKSLLGSHIDPNWNDQLKGTRAEMEDKVSRILNLPSGLDTEQLSELIQDLYKKYQLICDQYSNLAEEITNRVDEKQDNDTSSSSSDSDNSVRKIRDNRNGILEGESTRVIEKLEHELELAKLEVAETKKKNEDVHSEYRTALMKIEEAENTIVDLNTVAENYSAENKKLKEKLKEMAAEKENLIMEKEVAVRRNEESERVAEELRNEKNGLQEELRTVNVEVKEMKQKLESAEKMMSDLSSSLETTVEKNQSLTSQLLILKDEKVALQQELGTVNGEVDNLKRKLETTEKKMLTTMEETQTLTSQISVMKEQLLFIGNQRDQLESHLEYERRGSSETDNQKSKFLLQIEDQQRLLQKKEEEHKKLSEDYQILQHQLKKCKANLETAETKLEETETVFRLMKVEKEQEVAELEQMMDELKRDLELKGDEASSSIENVRNLEVKLRLSNQKNRVTDQLLAEMEDNFRVREAEYEREIRSLEDKIGEVTDTAASYERMIVEISRGVNTVMEEFDSVVMKLGDRYSDHTSSILRVGGEIGAVKAWVRSISGEKHRVEEELRSLSERVEQGKLRDDVERLEVKVSAEEAEKVRLTGEKAKLGAEMEQMKKKVEEMGMKLTEAKQQVAVLGEEKKEAIRQLCVWVDYQQSRYDNLVAKLKKKVC